MPIWILVHQKLFILSETMETSQDGKEASNSGPALTPITPGHLIWSRSHNLWLPHSASFSHTKGNVKCLHFQRELGVIFLGRLELSSWRLAVRSERLTRLLHHPLSFFFFSFFSFLNGVAKEKMGAYQENLWFCKFTSINYKLRGGSTTVRIWLIHRSTQFSVISAYLYSKHSSCFCFQLH